MPATSTTTPPRRPRRRALVTGAGGFIGHHLVRYLEAEGYRVRGADLVPPRFAPSDAAARAPAGSLGIPAGA